MLPMPSRAWLIVLTVVAASRQEAAAPSNGQDSEQACRATEHSNCAGGFDRHVDGFAGNGEPEMPVRLVGEVPRRAWPQVEEDDEEGFAAFFEMVVGEDTPVVLTDPPPSVLAWMQSDRWDEAALEQSMPRMSGVKVMPPVGDYMYPSDLPMAAVPEMMRGYRSHYSRHDMTAHEFLSLAGFKAAGFGSKGVSLESALGIAKAAEERPVRYVSLAAQLEHWPPAYRQMPKATKPFVTAVGANRNPQKEERDPHGRPVDDVGEFQLPYVWLTQAGAVTPCHYDNYRNFYVQMRGRKHFLIMPPASHSRLYPHPALHPAHRSARVRVRPGEPLSAEEAEMYPAYRNLSATEVNLAPGEVLFLPAMWFHQVTAVDSTVSLNIWSKDRAIQDAAVATEYGISALARNFQSHEERLEALRAMWQIVLPDVIQPSHLDAVTAGGTDPRFEDSGDDLHLSKVFVQRYILDRRYSHLASQASEAEAKAAAGRQVAELPSFCHDKDAFDALLRDVFAARELQQGIGDMVKTLNELAPAAGDRFPTLLANLIETVTHEVVGVASLPRFLQDWIRC